MAMFEVSKPYTDNFRKDNICHIKDNNVYNHTSDLHNRHNSHNYSSSHSRHSSNYSSSHLNKDEKNIKKNKDTNIESRLFESIKYKFLIYAIIIACVTIVVITIIVIMVVSSNKSNYTQNLSRIPKYA
jgi:hypothetical protein